MNKWLPSRIAISALYLARKMLNPDQDQTYPQEMESIIGLTEKMVRTSARDLCTLINLASTKSYYAPIFKKYSTSKFHKVAQVPVKIREDAQRRMNQMDVDQ